MVNLNYVLEDEYGKDIECKQIEYVDKTDEDGNVTDENVQKMKLLPMTAKYAIKHALAQQDYPDRDMVTKRYELIMKIVDKDEIEFYEEETELIIDLVCKKYGVMYAGQIIKLLTEK